MSSTGTAFDATTWLPPEDENYTVPLNLPNELARVGIAPQDRVVFERLPEGAALTIGECKPDGSWILLPSQLAEAEYIPLTHNGQTYVLQVSVLTEDPSDHGLPKTKARLQIAVRVPQAKSPVFASVPPASLIQMPARPADPPIPDGVIPLPAGPVLPSVPADGAPPSEDVICLPDASPRAMQRDDAIAPAVRKDVDLDQHLSAHAAEWQAHVRSELLAAESRLKAAQLEQIDRMRAALSSGQACPGAAAETTSVPGSDLEAAFASRLQAARQEWEAEAAARLAAAQGAWRAEALAQRTALEARLKEQCKAQLAALQSTWAEKTAMPLDIESLQAEIEGRMTALYDMRLAAAETVWRNGEAQRLAIAEAAWGQGEAERMAAAEARWRAEHEKRLEAVLANFNLLVRGQLGANAAARPLPAIPAEAAAVGPNSPAAGADGTAAGDSGRWQEIAAA